VILAPIGAACW